MKAIKSNKNAHAPFIQQNKDPDQIYQVLQKIGQGAYGVVHKAICSQQGKGGQLFAIKFLQMPSNLDNIMKEIAILQQCDNQHIIKYEGSYLKNNVLWIVLQYCIGGSVLDLMKIINRRLKQEQIATILQSVLHGLVYLHSHQKIHRDIKAANILLSDEGIAKLGDFGVSAKTQQINDNFQLTHTGSPLWMSPQILGYQKHSNKTDIWSLGITAIELAQGGLKMYNQVKPTLLTFKLSKQPIRGFITQPQIWSKQFNDFVSQCLQIQYQKRPSAEQLLEHEFITKKSKGKPLLTEFVRQSLDAIDQYRINQMKKEEQEIERIEEQFRQDAQTRTIVGNRMGSIIEIKSYVDQHKDNPNQSYHQDSCNNSMLIHQNTVEEHDVREVEASSPLTAYIASLQQQTHKQQTSMELFQQKLNLLDANCMQELIGVYEKWKKKGQEIVGKSMAGLKCNAISSKSIFQFINNTNSNSNSNSTTNNKHDNSSNNSHYNKSTQIKSQTIPLQLPKNKTTAMPRQVQRRSKKYTDGYMSGSQSPNDSHYSPNPVLRQSNNNPLNNPTTTSHNVSQGYSNKRFIATEPHQVRAGEVDTSLKFRQFVQDPDVKQNLLSQLNPFHKHPHQSPIINLQKQGNHPLLYNPTHNEQQHPVTYSPSLVMSSAQKYNPSSTQLFQISKQVYQGDQDYLILHQQKDKSRCVPRGKVGSRKKVKIGKSGQNKRICHHVSTNTQGTHSNFNSSISYTKSTSNIHGSAGTSIALKSKAKP